ncbi:MAG: hypothetical protein LAT55_04585 [Opitutales bacterium]|nr:hypothetical protein [Opitutales bacterium]
MADTPSETFEIQCPHCGALLEGTPELLNENVECPECGKEFVVTKPESTSPGPTGDSEAETQPPVTDAEEQAGEAASPPPATGMRLSSGGTGGSSLRIGGGPRTSGSGPKKGGKLPSGPPSKKSDAAARTKPAKEKKDKPVTSGGKKWKVLASLLVLLGLGLGATYYFGWADAVLPQGVSRTAGALPETAEGQQTNPPPASHWDPSEATSVTAFHWGREGARQVTDTVARGNGNLLITGSLDDLSAIPESVSAPNELLSSDADGEKGFLMEVSADGREILWFSYFGGNLIRPTRLAIAADGTIAIGGRALGDLGGHPQVDGDFQRRQSAVGRISADGSELFWMAEGGPNSTEVTGLAVDQDGRIYITAGGRAQGNMAYVLRFNPDGSRSNFARAHDEGGENWAINFDVRTDNFKAPGQIGEFYAKGTEGAGYDYDGEDGPWGKVRFYLHGIREGGQIAFLPNGDFIVTGTLQYDFREGENRRFPAFDAIVARYNQDGQLIWSTNLYQPGDSVHTPDQKPRSLVYNPVNGDLYAAIVQHGSNIYRFKGDLRGDTGNLMITWVGRISPDDGALKDGWYWMNNRHDKYNDQGLPQSPPHPRLSGNNIGKLGLDGEGRIYLTGNAGASAWTSPQAWRDWPSEQSGGGNPALIVLSPDLARKEYVTMIRGDEYNNGAAGPVALNQHGVWVSGNNGTSGFTTGETPPWAASETAEGRQFFLARFQFE